MTQKRNVGYCFEWITISHIYIYIHIHIHGNSPCAGIYIYIYMGVCIKSLFVGPKREKLANLKMNTPTKRSIFFLRITFVLTYGYASSLLLSSENI